MRESGPYFVTFVIWVDVRICYLSIWQILTSTQQYFVAETLNNIYMTEPDQRCEPGDSRGGMDTRRTAGLRKSVGVSNCCPSVLGPFTCSGTGQPEVAPSEAFTQYTRYLTTLICMNFRSITFFCLRIVIWTVTSWQVKLIYCFYCVIFVQDTFTCFIFICSCW